MNVGQKVTSDLYDEYGIGTIISRRQLFSRDSYRVFFENAGKTVEVYDEDLKTVETPLELFKSGLFSTANEFRLNYLASTIEATTSGQKPLSAANYKIMPLPHQIIALDRVVNQFRPRYLLADEVGLGKTIEAALIMEELKLRNIVNRVLIITPAGLTRQWQEEMRLKFDEDFSILNSGTFKSFKELYGQETNIWRKFNNVITSIDFLKPKRLTDDLKEKEAARRKWHNDEVFLGCVNANWDMVIIDEAHKLSKYQSGEETARYKLGKEISEAVPIFFLVTATPHRGKSDVFLNFLKLVDPYTFTTLDSLTPQNVKTVTVRNKKRSAVDFSGKRLFKNRITTLCKIERRSPEDDPETRLYDAVTEYVSEYYNYAKEENNYLMIFLLLLYQRIVSSSSKAIFKSLNRRLEALTSAAEMSREVTEASQEEFDELPGEEKMQILESIRPILNNPQRVKEEIVIVSNCIELAKNAVIGRNDSKLRSLMRIIDEVKRQENDKDLKVLIFTEFIETQKYIAESLGRLGYKTAIINGKMELDEKIRQKEIFRSKAQILISTDAGGEGINLQFCHVVINYDLPWNPMQIEQRIGRVDRIGQTKDVLVSNFIIANTVEERVRSKIESKLALIKEQFGEDKYSDILSTLSEDFNFDKLFIEFITRKGNSNQDLEDASNEIWSKAVEILQNDDMLVPFTDVGGKSPVELSDLKLLAEKVHNLTATFLQTRGLSLSRYKEQEGVYHFENEFRNDIFPRHFSNVIFEQDIGMDIENSVLLSFNHPYVRQIMADSRGHGRASNIVVHNQKFAGTAGYLFSWKFLVTNNQDMRYVSLVHIFLTLDGQYNRRISEYFRNIDCSTMDNSSAKIAENIEQLYATAETIATELSENLFRENGQFWKTKVDDEYEKMNKYYEQRGLAVRQITIDNIRDGKLKEIRREKERKQIEMDKRKQLFPDLSCIQIARVEFTWTE